METKSSRHHSTRPDHKRGKVYKDFFEKSMMKKKTIFDGNLSCIPGETLE